MPIWSVKSSNCTQRSWWDETMSSCIIFKLLLQKWFLRISLFLKICKELLFEVNLFLNDFKSRFFGYLGWFWRDISHLTILSGPSLILFFDFLFPIYIIIYGWRFESFKLILGKPLSLTEFHLLLLFNDDFFLVLWEFQ